MVRANRSKNKPQHNGGGPTSPSSPSSRSGVIRPYHVALLLMCAVIIGQEYKSSSRSAQATAGATTSTSTATAANKPQGTSSVSAGVLRLADAVATKDTSPLPSTATAASGCSPLKKRLIQKNLPDADRIIDATKCPNSQKWLSEYLDSSGHGAGGTATATANEQFVFLNFGCNKGYDSLHVAHTVSRRSDIFAKAKWHAALGIANTGACLQGITQEGEITYDTSFEKRPVEVHCIEAMPQTATLLSQAALTTTAQQHGLNIHNYAMTGTAGGGTILFPNPDGSAGWENMGIGHCQNPDFKLQCKEVPTMTVDEFVAKHVDINANNANRRIPYISVDVEGHDFTVIKGAPETLKRTNYLEFEYHALGDWNRQKLEDAIDMLKQTGFVCYWAGINRLWRITDCWMDHFEFHMWSNVACVAPMHAPELAEKMEQVFEDTIVEGGTGGILR